MVFRDNEMSEATASRLLTAKLNIAAARRSQSPTTSRGTRAAATAARAQLRKQLTPEKSAEIRQTNTLYNAFKRKKMPEDQSTEIRQKDADRHRRKANQR